MNFKSQKVRGRYVLGQDFELQVTSKCEIYVDKIIDF